MRIKATNKGGNAMSKVAGYMGRQTGSTNLVQSCKVECVGRQLDFD